MAILTAIIGNVKGAMAMICYEPLWRTMRSRNVTTYTLREKHRISHATVQRLQANLPVSTYTLDRLCRILDCRLEEIAVYVPDAQQKGAESNEVQDP